MNIPSGTGCEMHYEYLCIIQTMLRGKRKKFLAKFSRGVSEWQVVRECVSTQFHRQIFPPFCLKV